MATQRSSNTRSALFLLGACCLAFGWSSCASSRTSAPSQAGTTTPQQNVVAGLPRVPHTAILPRFPAHAMAPSAASVSNGRTLPTDALNAVERCSVCHAEIFEQWSHSAHRFSSMDNPFYETAFQSFRQQRDAARTRWCGGCHDPALLFAGDLDGPPIDRTHERAQLGVGCVLCHSIERVHDRTGNGNYVLTPDAIPMPAQLGNNQYGDAQPHRRRVGMDALHTQEFCASCHKVGIVEAVNEAHWLRGQNEFDAWEQSAYAGNEVDRYDPDVRRQTCQDCHMPQEPATRYDASTHNGRVRSHRFLGGHTLLAAYRGDQDMLSREQNFLRDVVRIDVLRASTAEQAAIPIETQPLRAGEQFALDVVLVNERVGHRFPAGTADVADTWIELTITDAQGHSVLESGVPDANGVVEPDAHRLEVRPIDEQGRPALLRDPHRYRAVAYDTTIPPRAARVMRYTGAIPSTAVGPFVVRARLQHRRLANPFLGIACDRARTEHHQACPPSPITTVAAFPTERSTALWTRLYDHGRAIGEVMVQERVAQARPSLERAAELAPNHAGPILELGRVATREGRTEAAWDLLDRARRIAPNTAVPAYLRAAAASDVWRFGEMIDPLAQVTIAVPRNLRALEMYANALGIAGRHEDALSVLHAGLAIDPERPQLQHLQAITLAALGAPESEVELARGAYARYRLIDEAPALRSRCKRTIPGCNREAEPVHIHELHAPGQSTTHEH